MMAMENATGEEESVEAQVDVVKLTGNHLVQKAKKDKITIDPKTHTWQPLPSGFREEYDAPSSERISAFLGDKNWSRRKVSDPINLSLK